MVTREEKLRRRKVRALEEIVESIKGMFPCLKSNLLPNGTFGVCGGCSDFSLCRDIQKLVKEDIKKTYDNVR